MPGIEFPVSFENPTYGLIGTILGGIVLILFYLSHKRLKIAEKLLELVEWRKLRRIVRTINVGTKASLVIALSLLLATPYVQSTVEVSVEKATQEQMAQYATTVIFLLDVSYSMNSTDLTPSRFEVAKMMTRLLVQKMDSKDLIGLISFAGNIVDSLLPTNDAAKIIEKTENQTLHPSTAMGTAIETAIGVLEAFPFGGKAIVIFSDGKNNVGTNVIQAADEAKAQKIPIFTVSLGTYGIGDSDPTTLREISTRSGGAFYEARNVGLENLAVSVSQVSQEVKAGALKATYDKLTIPVKDYQTPRAFFSIVLVTALLLAWLTGV